jgi:hypothetical protein
VARDAALLDLLVQLQTYNVWPVRHGSFVGLKGSAVGRVPTELWDLFEQCRPQLLRLLKSEPAPYRRRARRTG